MQGKLAVGRVPCSVDEGIIDRDAVDVHVSNRGGVRHGDEAGQESRVGDTGYNGGCHLAPVELQAVQRGRRSASAN